MKVWPFGVALRGEASNHLMLRWLMTVVVSDEEKAHVMRQVGTGKASASEPLRTRRNAKLTSKPDFRLFRSVPFAAGSLLIALQNLVMYACLFELPLVLDDLFELNAQAIGQLLTFLTVAMVAMSLLAGRLADRLRPRPVALAGALLCLVGLLALDRSGLSTPGDARIPLVLLGAGLGLSSPAAQSASLSAVAPEQSGMAAGVASTMHYLGAVIGIALLGRLLDLGGSRAQVLAEHRAVLAVFAVTLIGSLVCAAVLPRRDATAVLAEKSG